MSSTPSESGSALPLRSAIRSEMEEPISPRTGPVKVVSIAEPESLPPSLYTPSEDSTRIKQYKAGVADKRMTGRPMMPSNSSSRLSILSQSSIDEPAPASDASVTSKQGDGKHHGHHHHHHHRYKNEEQAQQQHDKLLTQVAQWLQAEKAKRAAKNAKRGSEYDLAHDSDRSATSTRSKPRTSSQSSDSSAISLEKLQRILEDNISSFEHEKILASSPVLGPRRPSHIHGRRRSSARKLGAVSSDTEYHGDDIIVPSCDVVLDNSKTQSYSDGTADSSNDLPTLSTSKRAEKERKARIFFKNEIVKIAHTLKLKGWRRVPLERGGDIEVERLSGALTNAVYVVSPPKNLPPLNNSNPAAKPHTLKPPPKLLLRIYGPQVEHLIDRENELGILRRLARKKIGPRLLGTFTNGRFEEFYNAQTLTADDLRVEDTSKQIAKRMRELHDGIDLLEKEREEGPFVWRNWDKWVDRCEEVITYLDEEILAGKSGKGEQWRSRGFVCGVPWPQFKSAVDKYRKWLYRYYGEDGVNAKLVFAHNDTQYGNILRLIPEPPSANSAPSPLLLPQNTHKQLVVIDFEYASANTPGLEFANHFTEWCYNYHDAAKPWVCNTAKYPTLEQQRRFIRSYVNHRPQFNPKASATPTMNPMDGVSKGSIGEFLLDSRTPGGSSLDLGSSALYDYREEEAQRERATERRVEELLKETHIWRVANSAQWVAWGIVQAKVPELDESLTPTISGTELVEEPAPVETSSKDNAHPNGNVGCLPGLNKRPEGLKAEALLSGSHNMKEIEALDGEEKEEFDYLAYAQDRAMFFWGDIVNLGLVRREELPENLLRRLKVVEY